MFSTTNAQCTVQMVCPLLTKKSNGKKIGLHLLHKTCKQSHWVQNHVYTCKKMFLQMAGWCFTTSTMSLCGSVLTALPSVVLSDPLTDKQCPLHPYTSLSRSGTAATLVPFPHWPDAYAYNTLTHSSLTCP